ncbi:MAG: hypothetical protein D6722_24220 [Bacteroidetes bacterium]|nr:MAG: hypothetical protein D6722_24220 [Bacteroidota bacterium]
MGHSLGLAHVNLATESGLPAGPDRNYTKSTDGINNTFDITIGGDALRGSADDIRGDDVNLHYFRMADNDPFGLAATVDATTYSRDLANLPGGDLFATNADRDVATALGYPNTEAVMQQGAFYDEDQRTLVYYRLRQAAADGTHSYSPVQSLRLEAPKTEVITMGPIPIRPSTYLGLYVAESGPVQLRLLSVDGREVQRWAYQLEAGRHELTLGSALMNLPAGAYLLEVRAGTYREVLRFTR